MGVGPLPKEMRDFHLLQREFCDTRKWDAHLFRNLPHTHLLVTDCSTICTSIVMCYYQY